ncbi:hypothetical protein C0995_002014 [Termitomyces sp. Mi166|nr:hypothetical protein C0995_002014 [Termitomyces sp. Mi166\
MPAVPTSGGGVQELTRGRPIPETPWFNGGCKPNLEWKWDAVDGGTERSNTERYMSKPRVERRRKIGYNRANPGVCDGQKNISNPPEILGQTFRDSRSPTPSNSSFDGTRSPTSVNFPLTSNYHHQLPAVSPALYRKDDSENLSSFYSSRAYVAIDPFAPSVAQSIANVAHSSGHTIVQPRVWPSVQIPPTGAHGVTTVPISRYIFAFFFDMVPRQIYLYFLFTLPSLYFSRVAQIFEEAELSMSDIRRMADPWEYPMPAADPQPIAGLKESWEHLIDSLIGEWIMLKFVSALLLSAILITLQIGDTLTDPYTRYSAFLALEAQKAKTSIWWNIWVLLAMPAVWLSWSILFYIACVMTLVWRIGTADDTILQIAPLTVFDPRIAVTFAFTLGLVYLGLIIRAVRDLRAKARKESSRSQDTSRNMYSWEDPGYIKY